MHLLGSDPCRDCVTTQAMFVRTGIWLIAPEHDVVAGLIMTPPDLPPKCCSYSMSSSSELQRMASYGTTPGPPEAKTPESPLNPQTNMMKRRCLCRTTPSARRKSAASATPAPSSKPPPPRRLCYSLPPWPPTPSPVPSPHPRQQPLLRRLLRWLRPLAAHDPAAAAAPAAPLQIPQNI